MRLGYNWKHGLFELLDQLGADDVAERLMEEGRAVPLLLQQAAEAGSFYRVKDGRLQYLTVDGTYAKVERGEGVLLLSDVKLQGPALAKNGSASLWDLGDGVVCREVHTKLTTIDPRVIKIIGPAQEIVTTGYRELVAHESGSTYTARRK